MSDLLLRSCSRNDGPTDPDLACLGAILRVPAPTEPCLPKTPPRPAADARDRNGGPFERKELAPGVDRHALSMGQPNLRPPFPRVRNDRVRSSQEITPQLINRAGNATPFDHFIALVPSVRTVSLSCPRWNFAFEYEVTCSADAARCHVVQVDSCEPMHVTARDD